MQSFPPYGIGLLHARLLDCVPEPHTFEQGPKVDHPPKPPSTINYYHPD